MVSTRTQAVFAAVTHLGDPLTLTALGISVAIALVVRGERWLALGWVVAIGGNAVVNPILKSVFERGPLSLGVDLETARLQSVALAENGVTVRVLGHRQTKGADNRHTKPNATASHLYSTRNGRSHCLDWRLCKGWRISF